MDATTIPASQTPGWREGFWAHGLLSPGRDEPQRRSTDAAKLTFPLQLVIVIIGGIVATTGAFWVSTSAMRSDLRDIKTTMDNITRYQGSQIDKLTRDEALDAVRIAEDRVIIAEIKGYLAGSGLMTGAKKNE